MNENEIPERPDEMLCPLVNRVIGCETCYETIMAVCGLFSLSSVPEMHLTINRESARKICDKCPYSDLS